MHAESPSPAEPNVHATIVVQTNAPIDRYIKPLLQGHWKRANGSLHEEAFCIGTRPSGVPSSFDLRLRASAETIDAFIDALRGRKYVVFKTMPDGASAESMHSAQAS